MANKLTLPEYNKIKNKSLCVVSFKDGKRTLTYGNISYKEAIDHVFKKQAQGEVCLIIPSSNEQGIKGLGLRQYNEAEETLEYYGRCLQENKEKVIPQNYNVVHPEDRGR